MVELVAITTLHANVPSKLPKCWHVLHSKSLSFVRFMATDFSFFASTELPGNSLMNFVLVKSEGATNRRSNEKARALFDSLRFRFLFFLNQKLTLKEGACFVLEHEFPIVSMGLRYPKESKPNCEKREQERAVVTGEETW